MNRKQRIRPLLPTVLAGQVLESLVEWREPRKVPPKRPSSTLSEIFEEVAGVRDPIIWYFYVLATGYPQSHLLDENVGIRISINVNKPVTFNFVHQIVDIIHKKRHVWDHSVHRLSVLASTSLNWPECS